MQNIMPLKSSVLYQLQKIAEKVRGFVSLSPDELKLRDWMRRMTHRLSRQEYYRSRNAAYPYMSKRQATRFKRKRLREEVRVAA